MVHIFCNFLFRTHDADDARMFFKYARANIKTLAIVHIEAAQFELDQGNIKGNLTLRYRILYHWQMGKGMAVPWGCRVGRLLVTGLLKLHCNYIR